MEIQKWYNKFARIISYIFLARPVRVFMQSRSVPYTGRFLRVNSSQHDPLEINVWTLFEHRNRDFIVKLVNRNQFRFHRVKQQTGTSSAFTV